MLVKTYKGLKAATGETVIAHGAATTLRFLTMEDGLGFSMSDVRVKAGAESVLWYKNHWEANYVLEGTGEVKDLATGKVFKLEAGVLYVVGPKDRHRVKALTDLHVVSIFNPPLRGDENHDADGSYPPTGPIPPGPKA